MGWDNSNRNKRLPSNWWAIRGRVLKEAQHQCEVVEDNVRCPNAANEVDHIIPGDDHSRDNLRAICPDHHKKKSSAEGNAARKAKYSRRTEDHPGYW